MARPGVAEAQAALEANSEQQKTGKKFQWSLFDTHLMATGDLEIQMFQTPRGQNGNGFTPKTLIQTNVKGAGTIPKGQQFEAHAVVPYLYANGTAINNATYLAIQTWMRQAMFRVSFPGGDDLIQERFDFIFGEMRQWLHVPTTSGDNIFPAQVLTPPGYYKLNSKLKFGALDSYEIRCHNFVAVASALNGFQLTLRLVGNLSRLGS